LFEFFNGADHRQRRAVANHKPDTDPADGDAVGGCHFSGLD
jgi:hypothetical protein